MTLDEMLAQLQAPVDRLHGLLHQPHDGMLTWSLMVGENWKAIAELWYGKALSEDSAYSREELKRIQHAAAQPE